MRRCICRPHHTGRLAVRLVLMALLVSGGLVGAPLMPAGRAGAADGDLVAILLKDVNPGTASSSPQKLVQVAGQLLFVASDPTSGSEWRRTDGTPAGTTLLKDIRPGPAGSFVSARYAVAGTNLFFGASDGSIGSELWKSDGTPAGTVLVKDVVPGSGSSITALSTIGAAGTNAYFTSGNGLWRSDGTAAGTVLLKDFPGGGTEDLTGLGNTLLFRGNDGNSAPGHGAELWRSDGTPAGTVMVKDLTSGPNGSFPGNFAVVGNLAYFVASGDHGTQLWRTDGTEAGTVELTTGGSDAGDVAAVGPNVFFSYVTAAAGEELWKSDGSPTGTVMLKDIVPGPNGSALEAITALGAGALLQATDPAVGAELWRTDGTSAGTTLVKDIWPGTGSGDPGSFAVLGPTAYFAATDGTSGPAHGTELWKSDGTAAGTALFQDIAPGPSSSSPGSLVAALGTVFFAATDGTTGGAHGTEPWALRANSAPVAGNDTYSTWVDTVVTVPAPGVLANDSDADGDAITAGSASVPAHGSVALSSNGAFTYTPSASFSGVDSFTYLVSDGIGGTATGTVTITTGGHIPVAVDDAYSTNEDTPLTVPTPGVLANDTDADADTLLARSPSVPAHGTLTLDGAGSFTYTPAANYNGTDSFTYVVDDSQGGTATATVSLTVTPVNDDPVPGPDAYTTNAGTPLTVPAPGVLGNDTDVEGSALSAGSASTPAHGTAVLNANGSFTYTPAPGFIGDDGFTYVVSDGSGTATGSVYVGVLGPDSVTSVTGSACGYIANFSLFGGPQSLRGCGEAVGPAAGSYSPSVALPAFGSPTPLAAGDPDGATAVFGPAIVFGGRWPNDVDDAPPSGPITVSTSGTPAGGAVTSVVDIAYDPMPVQCYEEPEGTANCVAPGGFGPPPVEGDSLHVECTASKTGVSGFTSMVNGELSTATTGQGIPINLEPVPANPPVNYTRHGAITNVGDVFTVVYNEQVRHPDGSLTVTGAHMYLHGPTAVGEIIKGRVTCGTSPHPATPPDTEPPSCAVHRYTNKREFGGVFDSGGLQSITNVHVTNGTVEVGVDPGSPHSHLKFVPGQTGPLGLRATPTNTSLPMRWSLDATDAAGNVAHCTGTRRSTADFDGNGSTDVSVYRPSTGTWYVRNGTTAGWGTTGDVPVPGDYDGNRATDIAVFRPSTGVWFVRNGPTVAFGTPSDVPVPADYDGNGTTDLAVFRPSTGQWFVRGGATVEWGTSGDVAVPADYDGDGQADIAVFRPSTGTWYVHGGPTLEWGTTGDVPVPGDYDDNGKTDIAVFRPSTGTWFVRDGTTAAWGTSGDVPVPGDYDGNGVADIAVYRPSSGSWYVRSGTTATWGASGDVVLPLPAAIPPST